MSTEMITITTEVTEFLTDLLSDELEKVEREIINLNRMRWQEVPHLREKHDRLHARLVLIHEADYQLNS